MKPRIFPKKCLIFKESWICHIHPFPSLHSPFLLNTYLPTFLSFPILSLPFPSLPSLSFLLLHVPDFLFYPSPNPKSNSLINYQKFTPSCCKDIGVAELYIMARNPLPVKWFDTSLITLNISDWTVCSNHRRSKYQ